jgi:predicted dehydrogenase
MFLLPEQRAIGKENFCAAVGSKPIRRELLKKTIASGVTTGNGLGDLYFGYGDSLSEPVRVGIIGTGDEAGALIGAINPKFITVKSIADIRPYSIWRAFHGDAYAEGARLSHPGLLKVFDWKTEDEARGNVRVYAAFEELIENARQDGIEGVIIVLPLHLHAKAAVLAMNAGLHVICEKLMAHSVHECKEMSRAAKQTNLLLAIGYQRHYNILYDNALELIRQGLLGELHYIRALWQRPNKLVGDLWQPTMPKAVKPDDPQADVLDNNLREWSKTLDQLRKANDPSAAKWEKKIAQVNAQMEDARVDAKKFGYEDMELKDADGKTIYYRPAIEELIRWRLWHRTGAGLMAELGSHQFDAAHMCIAAAHEGRRPIPLNVTAAGSHMLFPPDREVDDHVFCVVEYPAPGYDANDPAASKKKIAMQFATVNNQGFERYGETLFGTEGTMLVEAEEEVLLYKTYETGKKIRLATGKDANNNPRPIIQLDEAGDAESAAIGALGTLPANRGYVEELEHWAWCVRNRDPQNQPRSTPDVALADAAIVHTANMAVRKGERIEFKKEWFDVDSDETPEGVKPDLSK